MSYTSHEIVIRFKYENAPWTTFLYRLLLFAQITIPSLKKNDAWITLLVDDENRSVWRKVAKQCGRSLEVGDSVGEGFGVKAGTVGDVQYEVESLFDGCLDDAYQIITTRLDNDDAIAPDYCDMVRGLVEDNKVQGGDYICFPHGIYWDKLNGRCAHVRRKNNQFLSRLATRDNQCSVYEHKHGHATPIVHIETDEPMWVWTIHADDEKQMSNHKGSVRTALKNIPDSDWQDESILERFGIQV